MELNQHRIWHQIFGVKYMLKFKNKKSLDGLKKWIKKSLAVNFYVEFLEYIYIYIYIYYLWNIYTYIYTYIYIYMYLYIYIYISWPDISVGQSNWTEFSGRGFKSHSGQLSITTSKNPSVVNTICIISFRYTHVITYRKLRLNKRGDWRRQTAETKCGTEQTWNWSSCTKLVLSTSCTHDLIAQSVRATDVIQWSRVQIPFRPTFYSYFKEYVSGEYHIYATTAISHKSQYLSHLI